jgi:hypothetical protein
MTNILEVATAKRDSLLAEARDLDVFIRTFTKLQSDMPDTPPPAVELPAPPPAEDLDEDWTERGQAFFQQGIL